MTMQITMDVNDEIRQLHHGLLQAWNAQDAAAFAGLFAAEGTVIGFDGSTVHGRREIEDHIGMVFADHRTASYVAIVREVRSLAPDVALLRAAVGMVPPGQHDINPHTNAVQTLVAVRHDGRWSIELCQNTPAAFHGRPEAARQMTDDLRRQLATP